MNIIVTNIRPVRLIAALSLLTSLVMCFPAQAVDWQRPTGEEPPIPCEAKATDIEWRRIFVSYYVTTDKTAKIVYRCLQTVSYDNFVNDAVYMRGR